MTLKNTFLWFLTVGLTLSLTSASADTTITFDNITDSGIGSDNNNVNNGYYGLNWINFHVVNAYSVEYNRNANGYYNGLVSSPNVVYNGWAIQPLSLLQMAKDLIWLRVILLRFGLMA